MAPEVIACDPDSAASMSASYDTKSDIWSVGITAIEIAEKNPPLADIHPMRALHMIPTTDLGFAKPKSFSPNFRDFVNQCLTRDPRKRPSAEQMLQHPFLAKAVQIGLERRKIVIAELVQKYRKDRQKAREGYKGAIEEDNVDPFAQFDQPAAPPPPPPIPEQDQVFCSKCYRWKPRAVIVESEWKITGRNRKPRAFYRCRPCQEAMNRRKKAPDGGDNDP